MSPAAARRWAWLSVVAAVGAVVAASLVSPVAGDSSHLTLFGHPFGQRCAFQVMTGFPCPSCGMTRSWVWSARGELLTALRYNAAGAALLAGVVVNGVFGAVRLVTGWAPPVRLWRLLAGVGFGWLVVWIGGWALRIAGGYPMP